ncbi:MAG: thiolase [Gammaproteobacteria bacterium]|nr:thiolase [Gammaproteobacteria bacterium]
MTVAVVGASETTSLGVIPELSQMQLHADGARNALADAGLTFADIDGLATAGASPVELAHYLGVTPRWVDGTSVGGCSFLIHVRHAVAAIEAGYCETVLITHGESGRSRVGVGGFGGGGGASFASQFEVPFGPMGPTTLFGMGVLRFMKDYGLTHAQLASVAVAQREWAGMNPRAMYGAPITVDDVLSSRMVCYPFHLLECCLVTDGGGALILTKAERAKDFPTPPVYILGSGESVESGMISQMEDLTSSRNFKIAGRDAFASSGISHADVDHLMVYDAFAHLPLFGLADLGFMSREEVGPFVEEGNTRPGGKLPMNTNGGGLSYTHTGMYGMFALQESVRQVRGQAPAQVDGVNVSVCLGVGGMFAAGACIVFSNQMP